jgi:hypothetical protein
MVRVTSYRPAPRSQVIADAKSGLAETIRLRSQPSVHGVGIICAGQRIPLDEMCNWFASCERRATSIEQATAQI